MNIGWGLVLAVHLLGAVLWVGGMAFALMVLRPSMIVLEPPQRLALHVQVLRRFFLVVWHAVVALLLTGYAMVFGVYGGFDGSPWPVHVMQATAWVMVAVFLLVWFGPWAALRREPSVQAVERIRLLVMVNLWIGLFTVVIAALGIF